MINLYRFLSVLCCLVPGAAQAIDPGMPNPPASPTIVEVGLFVADIVDLDEVNENFRIELILVANWHDPRLAFDAKAEGTDVKIFQGAYQFNEVYAGWWPQLVIVNEVGHGEFNAIRIEVHADGQVRYLEQRNVTLETPMSLSSFPFDTQYLKAYIIPFGNSNEQVQLRVNANMREATDNYVQQHGSIVNIAEWSLEHLEMIAKTTSNFGYYGKEEQLSQVVLTITMKRKSSHIVWGILFPLVILVSMIWSIFWMENCLAERLNISFIGILTIVAYQFLIIDTMPRISYLTFTDAMLLSSFVIMSVTIFESLYIHNLVKRNKQAKAIRIDRISRWAFPSAYVLSVVGNYFYYIYF